MHEVYGPFDRPLRIVPPDRRRRVRRVARPRAARGRRARCTGARADGDPASDILIVQQVFYPYYSNTPKAGRRAAEGDGGGGEQGRLSDPRRRDHLPVRPRLAVGAVGEAAALRALPRRSSSSFAYKGRLLIVSPPGLRLRREDDHVTCPVEARARCAEDCADRQGDTTGCVADRGQGRPGPGREGRLQAAGAEGGLRFRLGIELRHARDRDRSRGGRGADRRRRGLPTSPTPAPVG